MPFVDSDEVRDYIGGVFVDAFADRRSARSCGPPAWCSDSC